MGDGNSANIVFKCVQGGGNVDVDDRIGWGVNRGVSYRVDISDALTFVLDDESKMGFFGYFIDGFNCLNPVG